MVRRKGAVLLVLRRHDPYAGRWALPGGFVNVGEDPEAAVVREVQEETGIAAQVVGLVGVFGRPGRDSRGHVVSAVYRLTCGAATPRGADDAAEARWWPESGLPPLAFDHAEILRRARRGGEADPSPRFPRPPHRAGRRPAALGRRV